MDPWATRSWIYFPCIFLLFSFYFPFIFLLFSFYFPFIFLLIPFHHSYPSPASQPKSYFLNSFPDTKHLINTKDPWATRSWIYFPFIFLFIFFFIFLLFSFYFPFIFFLFSFSFLSTTTAPAQPGSQKAIFLIAFLIQTI